MLGIVGMVVGGLGTGGTLCFIGVLLAGPSFIRSGGTKSAAKMSTLALTGIFFEPGNVFSNLRPPPIHGGVLITGLLNGIYVLPL